MVSNYSGNPIPIASFPSNYFPGFSSSSTPGFQIPQAFSPIQVTISYTKSPTKLQDYLIIRAHFEKTEKIVDISSIAAVENRVSKHIRDSKSTATNVWKFFYGM